MLKMFGDTDSNIPPQLAKEYGFSLISMPYCVNNETICPYEDFEEFDAHAYYDMLRHSEIPSTCSVNEEKYISYFEPVFSAGDDILYVHFSEKMSATFEAMRSAAAKLSEKYPERKFYAIDTKGIAMESDIVTLEIARQLKAGKSIEEILSWAEKETGKFAMVFFADDLKFLKKSGRIGGLSAMVGTIVGIRPIIHLDDEGKLMSVGKERGRIRAIERLVSSVVELGDEIEKYGIVIGQADAPDIAEELAGMLREKLGEDISILTLPINPTVGIHCGPNTVGLSFHAKHR